MPDTIAKYRYAFSATTDFLTCPRRETDALSFPTRGFLFLIESHENKGVNKCIHPPDKYAAERYQEWKTLSLPPGRIEVNPRLPR